jgi:hypothetical protein
LTCFPSTTPSRYWPITVFAWAVEGVKRRRDFSTFTFSSRTESAPESAGGSMATRQSSCIMWFCTMSRRAPYSS